MHFACQGRRGEEEGTEGKETEGKGRLGVMQLLALVFRGMVEQVDSEGR